MAGWKKIATLFALSTSLGLLGVACSTTADDPAATPDTAAPADEAQALSDTDTAGEAAEAIRPSSPNPIRHENRRPGRDWEREHERRELNGCMFRCEQRFTSCMRGAYGYEGSGPDRERRRHERCEHERFSCKGICRNRHD